VVGDENAIQIEVHITVGNVKIAKHFFTAEDFVEM
jgi:hypothetical protein